MEIIQPLKSDGDLLVLAKDKRQHYPILYRKYFSFQGPPSLSKPQATLVTA